MRKLNIGDIYIFDNGENIMELEYAGPAKHKEYDIRFNIIKGIGEWIEAHYSFLEDITYDVSKNRKNKIWNIQ